MKKRTVTLVHRERMMVPYTLDHDGYCKARGECACETRERFDGKSYKSRKEPSVLTLMPREVRKGVDIAVTEAVAVKQAIANRKIIVHKEF